jgi:hypothetical protein
VNLAYKLIILLQYSQYATSASTSSKDAFATVAGNDHGAVVVDEKVAQAAAPDNNANTNNQDSAQHQGQGEPPAAQGQGGAGEPNANENVNTIIDPGKPEPGRDIFAQVEAKIKSDTLVAHQKYDEAGEDAKEISSVNAPPVATTKPNGEGGATERDAQDKEGEKDGKQKQRGGGDTVATVPGATTKVEGKTKEEEPPKAETKEEPVGGLERQMGPHDEAGEAKEKAAEELFGDDSDE